MAARLASWTGPSLCQPTAQTWAPAASSAAPNQRAYVPPVPPCCPLVCLLQEIVDDDLHNLDTSVEAVKHASAYSSPTAASSSKGGRHESNAERTL